MNNPKIKKLFKQLNPLYKKHSKNLLFHGWHHIIFVKNKALEFADSINADRFIVEAAALTHDLNYLVKPNSEPEEGKILRQKFLSKAGFTAKEISAVEKVVMESHTRTRNENISPEGMALSDADTLFKALPITPIIFTQKYIIQNRVDIFKLAKKITSEQNPLLKKEIYFYTDFAKTKYLNWAKGNLQLWNNVIEALKDKDVKEVLKTAKEFKIL
ncbi:MAG: HD domain-containing protein [Candidatus Uhrbacteria bacterium]